MEPPPGSQSNLTNEMEIFSGHGELYRLEVYDGVQNDAAIAAVKGMIESELGFTV